MRGGRSGERSAIRWEQTTAFYGEKGKRRSWKKETYIIYIYIIFILFRFAALARLNSLDDTMYSFPRTVWDVHVMVIYRILHLHAPPGAFPSRIAIINWPDKTPTTAMHAITLSISIYSAYIRTKLVIFVLQPRSCSNSEDICGLRCCWSHSYRCIVQGIPCWNPLESYPHITCNSFILARSRDMPRDTMSCLSNRLKKEIISQQKMLINSG